MAWIATFISGCLFTWGGLAIYNYSFDPYGVFKENIEYTVIEPNLSFVKVNHILNQPKRYKTFSLGSSRVSHVGLSRLEDAYSLNLAEAVPEENLRIIRTLLEHNVQIKEILLGLDDISYLVSADQHTDFHRLRPHPEVSGESWWQFYKEYAFRTPTDIDKARIFAWRSSDIFQYDIQNTGRLFAIRNESAINKDPQRHITHEKFLTSYHYEGEYLSEGIEAITKIVKLCRDNNIQLHVFINPLYITTYLNTKLAQFSRFRRELAQVTDFVDFSGVNSITTNSLNYYEASHFRPNVGDMMLEKMLPEKLTYTGPEDFGRRVNSENIDKHIAALEQELAPYPDVILRNKIYQRYIEGKTNYASAAELKQLTEKKEVNQTQLCSLDEISVLRTNTLYQKLSGNHLANIKVRGWMGKASHANLSDHFIVSFKHKQSGKRIYRYSYRGTARPDVAAFFKDDNMLYTGFDSTWEITDMEPGDYSVNIMLVDSKEVHTCSSSSDKMMNIKWI